MKKINKNAFVLGAVVLTLAFFGCNSGKTSGTTAAGALIDGAALYKSDCSGCHGSLANSGKIGASVTQIQDAISHNWGGMGAYANLTTDQIQAIATALSVPVTTNPDTTTATNTTTSTTLDGAALYEANCSSCHGHLATSGKSGALAAAIKAAIANNYGGMGKFSNLTTAQLQAIADALATVPAAGAVQTPSPTSTPTSLDGAALYTTYCSSCHGALAASSKRGATAARIQAGVTSVNAMKSLSNLTSAQMQAIAAALGGAPASNSSSTSPATAPGTTTTDGAALYTTYCQNCHNPLASSSKTGRTATQIQTAINSVGNMSSLSGLTATQIQAIASALGTTPTSATSAPGTIDGAALYTQYCSGCHGNDKKGSSASSIQSAISSVSQMRSLSLTSAQIQAISTGSTVPAPTTSTTTASGPIDGAALYTQYCSGCHGALATSGHRGATVAQIQTGINTISGMMSLSTLTAAQLQAISDALNSTTPTSTSTSATAPTACGSCHAIPPATGHHSLHVGSVGLSCSTCHGTGYSKTTVNAATHANGVINIASGSTPGWNPTTRSCSNSCHGSHTW